MPGLTPVPVTPPGTGSPQEGQEAVTPLNRRVKAAGAGVAVMVIFHPLVKVIIFPTSFYKLPLRRLSGLATRAVTPAKTLWGHE